MNIVRLCRVSIAATLAVSTACGTEASPADESAIGARAARVRRAGGAGRVAWKRSRRGRSKRRQRRKRRLGGAGVAGSSARRYRRHRRRRHGGSQWVNRSAVVGRLASGAAGRAGASGATDAGSGNEPRRRWRRGLERRGDEVRRQHHDARQVRSDFITYWDQITPENEGKWGSVEGTRDQMNWAALDACYDVREASTTSRSSSTRSCGAASSRAGSAGCRSRSSAPRSRSGSACSASAIRTRS